MGYLSVVMALVLSTAFEHIFNQDIFFPYLGLDHLVMLYLTSKRFRAKLNTDSSLYFMMCKLDLLENEVETFVDLVQEHDSCKFDSERSVFVESYLYSMMEQAVIDKDRSIVDFCYNLGCNAYIWADISLNCCFKTIDLSVSKITVDEFEMDRYNITITQDTTSNRRSDTNIGYEGTTRFETSIGYEELIALIRHSPTSSLSIIPFSGDEDGCVDTIIINAVLSLLIILDEESLLKMMLLGLHKDVIIDQVGDLYEYSSIMMALKICELTELEIVAEIIHHIMEGSWSIIPLWCRCLNDICNERRDGRERNEERRDGDNGERRDGDSEEKENYVKFMTSLVLDICQVDRSNLKTNDKISEYNMKIGSHIEDSSIMWCLKNRMNKRVKSIEHDLLTIED